MRPKALRDDPDRRPSEDDLAGEHLGRRGVPGCTGSGQDDTGTPEEDADPARYRAEHTE